MALVSIFILHSSVLVIGAGRVGTADGRGAKGARKKGT
jgi:hypothetical protein